MLRAIPFGFQLVLAPVLALVLCVGLLLYLYVQVNAVYVENELMRQKAVLISESRVLSRGVSEMLSLANQIDTFQLQEQPVDDLMFLYLDEYRLFDDGLMQPVLQAALLEEQRETLRRYSHLIRYQEPLDIPAIRLAAEEMEPWLDEAQQRFFTVKRQSYLEYYRKVDAITEGLKGLILKVLVAGALLVLTVTALVLFGMRQRLDGLASEAGIFCPAGDEDGLPKDKFSRLQRCLQMARRRLPEIGAQEKLLQGVEADRRRLAMDVHDVTLSDVTATLRDVRQLKTDVNESAVAQVSEVEGDLVQLLDNLRGVVEDLYPRALDMLGFESAVEAFVQKKHKIYAEIDFHLLFECSPGERLSEFERLNMYRIVQEGVNNAIKHSKASQVEISFRCTQGSVLLSIDDNGVGAELPLKPEINAYGVSNIRQRAQALGADVDFTESRFSSGLRVEVSLPIKELALSKKQ